MSNQTELTQVESNLRSTDATTYSSLNHSTAELRDRTRILSEDASDLHSGVQDGEWDERTNVFRQRSVPELLNRLTADVGLSWTDVARLLEVSVPAIRKWRRGEASSAESRLRLAKLCAFIEMLETHFPIADAGQWIEGRLSDESPLTGIDVYCARPTALFELAGGAPPRKLLDEFDPEWPSRLSALRAHRVVVADDGNAAIVVNENA